MENSLIKKVRLNNDLHLEFYDASKKVAGDRWLVKMTARIEVPVKDYLESIQPDMDVDDILKVLGRKVIFEKNMERNFIDNKEKEKVLNEFCESFSEIALTYLSEANFPKQFIAKKYQELKTRESWNKNNEKSNINGE